MSKSGKYIVHSETIESNLTLEAHNEGFALGGNVSIQMDGITDNSFEPAVEKAVSNNDERDGWGNKVEFILAILSFAVGLGAVWRFPYLAQRNGGGAFLIPYTLALFLMGIPIFLLEIAIGQRLRRGPLHVWNKLAPRLTGIGMASVGVSFLIGLYYNMIIAWCFYYFFISFSKELPYAKCPTAGGNETHPIYVEECLKSSPTKYYWYRVVLTATDSIEESGGLNWKLCLCLLLAWIIVFVVTSKGTSSMGKVAYFTALFPYVVLIIFFVRAMMLDGAADGIKHMFRPQLEYLKKPEVWLDASTQIFYSLSLSYGGLISMASYNDMHNNIVRDAILVSCVNCGTAVFAGIVVFGILGYKANINYKNCLEDPITYSKQNGTCDKHYFLEQVAEGPGLTFIAFTEAISTMAVPQLWSVLFFLMLLTLGIGSMLGTFEAVRVTLLDLKLLPVRKEIVSLILCIISFGFGLLFCQRSGEYWLQMFDSYSANFGLLTIGFFGCIAVVWIYGIKNFSDDFEFMLGKKPNIFWRATWMFITPGLVLILIGASIYSLSTKAIMYNSWNKEKAEIINTKYPDWGAALCVILVLCSVIFIPIVAVLIQFDLFKVPGHEVNDEEQVGKVGKSETKLSLTID